MDLAAEFAKEQNRAFKRSSAVKRRREPEVVVWGLNDPEKYYDVYGRLPAMTNGEGLGKAFANGPATHNKPLIDRVSIEVLPGVFSFDRPLLEFQRALSNDLNERFPVDLDEELFSTTGIHATFDNLRCPAGYFQDPMSYTTVDNSLYRRELGLSDGYTTRQRSLAEEFWTLIFSNAKLAPVNVAKLSTGGMRRFTSSAQWKVDFANFVLSPTNLPRVLDAVRAADWMTLANDFEMLFATYIQKRGQVDAPGKVRQVFDLEYALSGGRRGKVFPTDGRVAMPDGGVYDDFAAMRARVVHAGPYAINCVLQVPATVTMQAMFELFPKTFHVNTREQIKAIIDGHYIYCSDVTEYDRSMSRQAIEVPHECMREFWDDRLVDMSWRLYTAPYFAKPLQVPKKGLKQRGQWVLDPTDWKQEVFAGNRSGHAFTSLIAKGNKVIETMFLVDMLYPLAGRVKDFLDHKLPIKVINNGDDEVVVFENLADKERFIALRSDLSNGHYVVEPEVGNGYSGMLLLKTDTPLVYNPSPRVHTSLSKTFTPEHAIGGAHRPYWPIGLMDRIGNLTASEVGREIWAVTMHHYRTIMEPHYGSFDTMLVDAVSSLDVDIDGLPAIDREVLVSRDKIHHRYLPSEVSDAVLDKITAKIPVERVESVCKWLYSGTLH